MSMDIIKHAKPIFEELQNGKLLKKCLHGKTQNQNESFNSVIWKRVPKDIYIGARTFSMGGGGGVNDAIAHFNDGNVATLNIYNEIGIDSGHYTYLLWFEH